jgi:O-antigen/teichoic acid export membrane protein
MHSEDGPETFRIIARLYMGLACAGIVGLTVLSPLLVKWLTAPEFHDAWPIVGLLAWQSIFYGFYMVASVGIWKAEKTYLSIYLMSIAAIVGLLLNWLLVPAFGGVGAAIATAITYLVWIIASTIVSESLWRVRVPLLILSFQVSFGMIFVAWFIISGHDMDQVKVFLVAAIIAIILLVSSINLSALGRLINK